MPDGRRPQNGDNHILLAPLAFNLLMGRSWPPATILDVVHRRARTLVVISQE